MRTHVDRGGTFTDVVHVDDSGRVHTRKVRSDEAIVGELVSGTLTFGTTVATNALLERTGVPTLLVATAGFADLVRMRDGTRPGLFDPDARWPEPLCSRVVEVEGRIGPDGAEIGPLRLPLGLDLRDVEAVAVVLLHSHANAAHEHAVAAWLHRQAPHVHVALGHEVSPEVGYLARIETTLVDAAITPVLRRSLVRDRIPEHALAMRSDGSLAPAASLRAADAVLSGPAGGVLAVAEVARRAGFAHAVGLDMGGTSTDVCRVDVGELPRREGDVEVAGVRLRRPMLEVDTIAAGGGSILWSDGVRLGVGPRSAGAHPGPQCYGRGGPPTLTDAALATGLVDAGSFTPPLDPSAVDLPGDADAFLAIAREAMAAAVRRLAASRGVDLRHHALVAYGGAAGQHAAEVARRVGIRTVLVHPCAAVLSAWGQALARREEERTVALWCPLEGAAWAIREALAKARLGVPVLGVEHATIDLRHTGTDHALPVALRDDFTEDALAAGFAAEHRRRYGFDREATIEVVNVRVRVATTPPVAPRSDDDPFLLGATARPGPALLVSPTTAVHVPPGWVARAEHGMLRLDDEAGAPVGAPTERTPFAVALWGKRLMAVAEQAGEVLRRLARSVNIRERLDFSCAVFDGEGNLIANAPHIPVHLGAMGETVRDLLRTHPGLRDGDCSLCNDPAAGGSHLPDLTVTTVVEHDGCRFFVASRGHHVDVGGITPGSMPPAARSLDEEGRVFRHVPLVAGGRLQPLDLAGCREPATVRADLEAQIAANAHAASALRALGPGPLIATWMAHLQDVAEELVARVLPRLDGGSAADTLDGVPLRVATRVVDGVLHVSLDGTGGPHAGNLNAPPAVVRAAVLYVLRVLVAEDVPLNEGALRRVRITTPRPSVVAPPAGAAVAGGNVETSQRLVDLLLRAAGAWAASQGTMNNLTLGGDDWAFYETIPGGQGAGPRGDGASGRQVHMTNTRTTDPEVLEARLPLRVWRAALRPGSGGVGVHRGGDGIVRELEVLAPCTAALLATRRHDGAPGLHGGGPGAPGEDAVCRDGVWQRWDRSPVGLSPGDRVRVATPGGGGYGG